MREQEEQKQKLDTSEMHPRITVSYAAKDFKKLKTKNTQKIKRGQEEDVLSAMKSLLNPQLLPHSTRESQPSVTCAPHPSPLTFHLPLHREPEN